MTSKFQIDYSKHTHAFARFREAFNTEHETGLVN